MTRSGKRYRSSIRNIASGLIGSYSNYRRPQMTRLNMRSRYRSQGTQTTANRRNGTSGIGVTGQYDRKMVYRKRNMPRYKKRRWRKFTHRVHAVAEKDLGSQTILFNRRDLATNSTAGFQIIHTVTLYGNNGGSSTGNGDLNYIASLGNSGNPTQAGGATINPSTKILFQSAVLDITIQNTSTYTSAGPQITYPPEAKMEVDLYEITIRKDAYTQVGGSNTSYFNLGDLYSYNPTYQYQETDGNTGPLPGSEIQVGSRGATPFEMGTTNGAFGIKVWKKTKYMLNQGETVTYQVRDPKRRVMERVKLGQIHGFNQPGWTKIIFIIGKLTPQANPVGSAVGTYQEILTIGKTRKYMYKAEGLNDDRSLYLVG